MDIEHHGTCLKLTTRVCKNCGDDTSIQRLFIRSNHEINSIPCEICGRNVSRMYHCDMPRHIFFVDSIIDIILEKIEDLRNNGIPIRRYIITDRDHDLSLRVNERIADMEDLVRKLNEIKDEIARGFKEEEERIINRLGVNY